jgi:hypothetical protein
MAPIARPCRRVADGVQHLLDGGTHGGRRRAAPATATQARRPGKGEEVGALGLVQLERPGQGV